MSRLSPLLLLLLVSFIAGAQDKKDVPPPLDPAYMGSHDMVLVSMGTTLFAYPMPGYEKPDNQQILYKVSTKTPSIRFLVRDADLVTARSQPFNLQRLIRGEQVEVVMDIYMGHFDRGGMKLHEKAVISFDEQKYLRTFEDIQPSSIRQVYDKVKVGSNEFILVHRLQEKPTYDNLILFDDMVSCITEFSTPSAVPTIAQLFSRLTLCGPMKPLYYETEDFQ
ncbi:hypothetical protein [Planctobacterium marinum]|uniref:Uncharacterized protein n=1 Tax=Planctobacterium marinum TaxID=1631968 RepID=A0AA48HQN6_9ALTE|nr:hypothetical protein MACH26_24330 [Planctobacterium marinum]